MKEHHIVTEIVRELNYFFKFRNLESKKNTKEEEKKTTNASSRKLYIRDRMSFNREMHVHEMKLNKKMERKLRWKKLNFT